MELFVYKLSSGVTAVLVPIGFKEYMFCVIKNELELGEIVKNWRYDDLAFRRSVKFGSVKYKRLTVVTSRDIRIMKNYQWFAFSGGGKGELLVGGQSWGMIVSVEKIPHDLPIEKPSKKRKLITQDKTVISAIPLRWEVLPPGWWRERGNNTKLLTSKQRLHYDRVERLKYIDSLNPEKVYLGKNYLGERIYYVAVFKSCVVAESATYGNAAYFVFDIENWQKILSHSKKDVLKLNDAVLRVPHIFDWRTKIANVIRNVRGHPKPVDIL